MSISGTFQTSFGSQKAEVSMGSISTSETMPSETILGLGVEYGYFLVDNLKLSLGLAYPFTSTPTEKDDDKWLSTSVSAFTIIPNISYYFPITEDLFYTPGLEFAIIFGQQKEMLSRNETYNNKTTGWGACLSFLSFEYKVSERFGIGLSLGSLNYTTANANIEDYDISTRVGAFQFDLNTTSSVDAVLYF